MHVEIGDLARRKELTEGQERNRINRETRNRAWLKAVPQHLNGTELSWEELQDNILPHTWDDDAGHLRDL